MRRRFATGLLTLLLVVLAVTPAAGALAVPPAPKDIPVVDQTGTLNDEQRQALAAKIAGQRQATGNQIAILMVRSLDGQAIEDYSLAVARGWGIGQAERDSGVLLLVAKDDRRLRIEVGYGLEGALPDVRANRIITERIRPEFREDRYYEGLDRGLDGVIAAIKGEGDPQLSSGQQERRSSVWTMIGSLWWLFLLAPVWLASILGRTKSWWLGGVLGAAGGVVVGLLAGFVFWGIASVIGLALIGLIFDKLVSDNYKKAAFGSSDRPSWWAGGPWLGGGGTGGSGSGGFGGFSGGSFGGGGSSGSW